MMQGEHRRWINGGKEKKQQTEEVGVGGWEKVGYDRAKIRFDSIRSYGKRTDGILSLSHLDIFAS